MAHTNKTTNLALPQWDGTDKPSWLTDVNDAFLAIDNGVTAVDTKADTNTANIATNAANITTNATAISTLNSNLASLANVNTTITMASGYTAQSTLLNKATYSPLTKAVTINLGVSGPVTNLTEQTICTIPTAYAPSASVYGIWIVSGTMWAQLTVKSDGSITLYGTYTGTGQSLRASISYVVG